jgi:hypothetical protein
MAVLVAIGLVLATVSFLRRQYFPIVAAFWVVVLGLALTDDPTQAHRFLAGAPLMAIFAAIALTRLGSLTVTLLPFRWIRTPAAAATIMVVLIISVWNVRLFFDPQEEMRFGGNSTLSATVLAYYLRERGTTDTVYFLGAPRMYYYGFQNIPFIARKAKGVDVVDKLGPESQRPAITGPTVFAALPEREGELEQVRAWFPGGETRRLHSEGGQYLVTVYVPPDQVSTLANSPS